MTAEGRQPTVAEIPADKIREAIMNGTTEGSVRVQRRNHRGQLQTLWTGVKMALEDLYNLEQQIQALAGGGQYRVEVRSLLDPAELVIPPFSINIEGTPRPIGTDPSNVLNLPPFPPPHLQQGPSLNNPNPLLTPPASGFSPPGVSPPGLTPFSTPSAPSAPSAPNFLSGSPSPPVGGPGWGPSFYGPPQPVFGHGHALDSAHLPPGATIASDQLALKQIADLKAEIAELRAARNGLIEKLEDERRRHADEIRRLVERVEKTEREARDREYKTQIEALEKRLLERDKQKQTSVADYAPVLSALAPVLTAMLTSGRDVTAKAAESQTQLMTTLLQTQAQNKNSQGLEMVKALAPVVTPLILEMVKARGPEAQAKAYETLAESSMQQIAMMAQFLQTMAQSQGEQSPWLPFIQQAISGIMETIGTYLESKKQAQATSPPRIIAGGRAVPLPPPPTAQAARPPAQAAQAAQGPAVVDGPSPATVGATYHTASATPAAPAAPATPPKAAGQPSPKLLVEAMMMSPQLPAEYKTPEWRELFLAIHKLEPVEQVAQKFVDHCAELAQGARLPPGLHDLFEDPEAALQRVLPRLPVVQYAEEYARQLFAQIVAYVQAVRDANESSDEAEAASPEQSPPAEQPISPQVHLHVVRVSPEA